MDRGEKGFDWKENLASQMRTAYEKFFKENCGDCSEKPSDSHEMVEKYFLANCLNCKTLDIMLKDTSFDQLNQPAVDTFIRTVQITNRKEEFFNVIENIRNKHKNNKTLIGIEFENIEFNALMGLLYHRISEYQISFTKDAVKDSNLVVLYASACHRNNNSPKLENILKIEVLDSVDSERSKISKLYFIKKFLNRLYKLLIEFYCLCHYENMSSRNEITEAQKTGSVHIFKPDELQFLRDKLKVELHSILKFPLTSKEEKWSAAETISNPNRLPDIFNRDLSVKKFLSQADIWNLGIKLAEQNLVNKNEKTQVGSQTVSKCELSLSQATKAQILSIKYSNLEEPGTYPKDVIGMVFIMVCRPKIFKLIKDMIDFSRLSIADKSDKSDFYSRVPSVDKKKKSREKEKSDFDVRGDFSDEDPELDTIRPKKIKNYHQSKLTELICEACTKSKKRFAYSTNLSPCEVFSSEKPVEQLALKKEPDFEYFLGNFGNEALKTINRIFDPEGWVFEIRFSENNRVLATAKHKKGNMEIQSCEFNLKEKSGLSELEVKAYCLLHLTYSFCPEFMNTFLAYLIKKTNLKFERPFSQPPNQKVHRQQLIDQSNSNYLIFSSGNEAPWTGLKEASQVFKNKLFEITYCGYSKESASKLKPLFRSELTQDQWKSFKNIQLTDGLQKLNDMKRILKQAVGLELAVDIDKNQEKMEIWVYSKETGKLLWNGLYSEDEVREKNITQLGLELFALQIFGLLMLI